jgi:adenylate cyclase
MVRTFEILESRILIVDDLESNVLLLERTLRGAGYVSVQSTMDPREVSVLHRRTPFDLILLDLKMPGMDGFEVMKELGVIEGDGYLPVLVITAEPGHKLRALREGARDFVSKPLDLAEVLMRVRNVLEISLLRTKMKALRQELVDLRSSHEASSPPR